MRSLFFPFFEVKTASQLILTPPGQHCTVWLVVFKKSLEDQLPFFVPFPMPAVLKPSSKFNVSLQLSIFVPLTLDTIGSVAAEIGVDFRLPIAIPFANLPFLLPREKGTSTSKNPIFVPLL